MDSYQRMRSIGVSVETADALAPTIDALTPRKREAFFMWSSGMTMREIEKAIGIPRSTVCRIVKIKWDKASAICP